MLLPQVQQALSIEVNGGFYQQGLLEVDKIKVRKVTATKLCT